MVKSSAGDKSESLFEGKTRVLDESEMSNGKGQLKNMGRFSIGITGSEGDEREKERGDMAIS